MVVNPFLYIAFALSFTIFAFIHSVTASNWFRRKASIAMGERYRHYRLLYNIVSIITFLPAFLIWRTYSIYAPIVYSTPQFLHLPLYAVQILCLIAAGATFVRLDFLEFVGLNIKESKKGQTLVTTGLYGLVRHPMYLFIIIFLWAKPVFNLLYLLAAFLFTAYFAIGAFLEEQKLIEEFGDEYRRYQGKVPMFVPFKSFK